MEKKVKNIQTYIPENDSLLPVVFDNDDHMFSTVRNGLVKIAELRWSNIKRMFADFELKDIIIYGDIAGYVYNANTEVSIGIVADVSPKALPYLKQINFALVDNELPYRFILRTIHCYILSEVPKNEPCYSLHADQWINIPQKQKYPFTVQEFCRSFESYMNNISDYIESLPKHQNQILTMDGIKSLDNFLKCAENEALKQKTSSKGGEYSLEYLLWRTFSDIGELNTIQQYVINSHNFNINELSQC